jgi:general secretion pathway protein F
MSAFSYVAINEQGKKLKGVLEGDSERQIRSALRSKGLTPVSIGEAGSSRSFSLGLIKPGLRIEARELALITRQLATLIQSGMPLAESLQATANQSRRARVKSLLLDVRSRVTEGHTLAYALAEFPTVFDELYVSTVRAGEHAGYLGQVLERLADYTEARQFARQKVRMALFYPAILIGVAIAVIGALMVFVVPELIRIFAHADTALPLLTRALIATSHYLADYGLVSLLVLLLMMMAVRSLLRRPLWKAKWHRLLLRLPLVGNFIRSVETARFASTLSILMESGVPLLDSLGISAQVLTNVSLQRAARQVAQRVEEGSSLHKSLEDTNEFPIMMVHMIASGEASGSLEQMLNRAATNQEKEQDMTLQTALAVFEPLLIVFMGGIVLLIVLAVLMPIFDLNKLVG